MSPLSYFPGFPERRNSDVYIDVYRVFQIGFLTYKGEWGSRGHSVGRSGRGFSSFGLNLFCMLQVSESTPGQVPASRLTGVTVRRTVLPQTCPKALVLLLGGESPPTPLPRWRCRRVGYVCCILRTPVSPCPG